MRKSRFHYLEPAPVRKLVAPRALLKSIVFDGYDYGLLIDYFEGANEILKQFGGKFIGAKDHPYYRFWRFPKRDFQDNAIALYEGLRGRLEAPIAEKAEQFLDKIHQAGAQPEKFAFIHGLKATIYPIADGSLALASPYHTGIVSIARNMGARYMASMKVWKFSGTSASTLKNNLVLEIGLQEEQVVIFDGTFDIVDDQFSPIKFNEVSITIDGEFPEREEVEGDGDEDGSEVYLSVTAPLSASELSLTDIKATLANYSLYEFQNEGVLHLASKSSALLADDMGLGKSRQAVVAADILTQGKKKVLIACPASLIVNWTREIRLVIPEAEISTQKYSATAQWVVTNYERLEELIGLASEFAVMIIDEAHFLKEPHVARTRLAFDIASKIHYRFLLTGTPILNRESEIHTLLRLSGHPVGQIPLKEFEKQFAGSPEFRAELNKRIQEWMLRRMKDMVLTHLQGKQHQLLPIAIEEERMAEYQKILHDRDLYPLQKVIALRQWLEETKISVVVEMAQELQAEDKLLVFCEFKATVEELKCQFERLGISAVTLTGDDTPSKRQKTVDVFQTDPDTRVFIGTTMAAGVGLNLTAANYVVFASLPWTPALKEQAEDRAFRNGQKRLVIVKIPLVDKTIDAQLWDMLAHKKNIAAEVLNPDDVQADLALTLKARA